MRGTGMRAMRSSGVQPNWSNNVVDRQDDHIKICYGAHRMPVALVARVADRDFVVEFLIGKRISLRRARVMLAAVRAESTFTCCAPPARNRGPLRGITAIRSPMRAQPCIGAGS